MVRSFLFFLLIASNCIYSTEKPLPGRLGSDRVYIARFGDSKLFFYMSKEKYALARQFIDEVNNNMLHTMTKAEIGCEVNEVTPVATTDPSPVGFDENQQPIFVDDKGTKLFRKHSRSVKKCAEKALGIHIDALSQEMSLIMNFDANKFHQDQCPVQYEYLKKHSLPIPRYTIFQDLTLMNWEMGKGTISGTILEDAESEDSFLLCFMDNEIVCNVYTEPALYPSPQQAPEYPGAATLAPHSPIPPIDRFGGQTVGSGKGKRISVAVRGLVRTEEIMELESKAKRLDVDRPVKKQLTNSIQEFVYPNQLRVRQDASGAFPVQTIGRVTRLKDSDGVEVYSALSDDYSDVIHYLEEAFNIDTTGVEVRHLIKRGAGFSSVKFEEIGLGGEYDVYILNSSHIPKNYRQYPISEDCTNNGKPWMQMYHFPLDSIMTFKAVGGACLLLTPIDEIMFRDGIYDIESSHPNDVFEKFYTQISIYAVPKAKSI